MSNKSFFDDVSHSTETCEATLAALATQINEFVHEGTLDSRCAAKLVKRLKKEADAIWDSGKATKPSREQLKKAFDALDATLLDHEAGLLVTAYAALRASEDAAGAIHSR
jgi:uncharacterized protein Yka (UPF0111/DUF47 family)